MPSSPTKNKSPTVQEKLDALLEAEAKKPCTNRVLLAVQSVDKSIDYSNCAGLEPDLDVKSPFFIASITKLFTAAIIMQLVDENKVDLDAPICQYLPSELTDKIHVYKGRDYSNEIKVHELLHQTSGLPDYFLGKAKREDGTRQSLMDDLHNNIDGDWPLSRVLDTIREMKPSFPPSYNSGKRSLYSDTNYRLLGAIVEHVTGTSFKDNLQERIVLPLGLSEKTYASTATDPQPNMYCKDTLLSIPKTMASFGPDGGIVSTLDDMMKFLRAFFEGKLFSRAHFDRMQAQFNTVFGIPILFPIQYGYGLMSFQLPRFMTLYITRPPQFLGHSGVNASFAFYVPDKQAYIVGTFAQIEQESRPFEFLLKVADTL